MRRIRLRRTFLRNPVVHTAGIVNNQHDIRGVVDRLRVVLACSGDRQRDGIGSIVVLFAVTPVAAAASSLSSYVFPVASTLTGKREHTITRVIKIATTLFFMLFLLHIIFVLPALGSPERGM